MNFEKPNTLLEPMNKEDKNIFTKEFNEEKEKLNLDDKQAFDEIISGSQFDKNLSKEENFKLAFDGKINKMINGKLENIDDETKEKLEIAQSQLKFNSIDEIIELYIKIKEILDTRNGSTAIKTIEHQRQTPEDIKEQEKEKSKSQEFISKLKEAIRESQIKEEEKRQRAKEVAEKIFKIEEQEKIIEIKEADADINKISESY